MKGLERLSEDLKQERQKATSALQDRARLRIEIENLKGQNQQLSGDLTDLQQKYDNLISEKQLMESKLNEKDSVKMSKDHELLEIKKTLDFTRSSLDKMTVERDEKVEELAARNEKVNSFSQRNDILEGKLAAKEELIFQLKEEIGKLKNKQTGYDDKEVHALSQLNDRSREIQELRNRAKQAEIVKESYQQQFSINKEIKQELEAALEANSNLTQQLRDSTLKNFELSANVDRLEDQLSEVNRQQESLYEEKSKLETAVDELDRRMRAESELAAIASKRADVSTNGKVTLERQFEELRHSHSLLLESHNSLEMQLNSARTSIISLNNELTVARDRAELVDAALIEANNAQAMSVEIEYLRAQLTEVRKQLIRRGIDDEAGALAPKAIIDREAHSRQVHFCW